MRAFRSDTTRGQMLEPMLPSLCVSAHADQVLISQPRGSVIVQNRTGSVITSTESSQWVSQIAQKTNLIVDRHGIEAVSFDCEDYVWVIVLAVCRTGRFHIVARVNPLNMMVEQAAVLGIALDFSPKFSIMPRVGHNAVGILRKGLYSCAMWCVELVDNRLQIVFPQIDARRSLDISDVLLSPEGQQITVIRQTHIERYSWGVQEPDMTVSLPNIANLSVQNTASLERGIDLGNMLICAEKYQSGTPKSLIQWHVFEAAHLNWLGSTHLIDGQNGEPVHSVSELSSAYYLNTDGEPQLVISAPSDGDERWYRAKLVIDETRLSGDVRVEPYSRGG